MYQVAVVEDDDSYAKKIEEYIGAFAGEKNLDIRVTRYKDAIFLVENYKSLYQIIFLDIEMPLLNGMEAAKKIRQADQTVCLIFITNLAQFACEGYGVNALDFIVKPIGYAGFKMKFSRAIGVADKNRACEYAIPVAGGVRRVSVRDIQYVEVRAHTVYYGTAEGVIESRGVLKEVEKRLEGEGFARINKSVLVNFAHIKKVDGLSLIAGETEFYIGTARRGAFMREFAVWQSGRKL